jgi:hypothetical protein
MSHSVVAAAMAAPRDGLGGFSVAAWGGAWAAWGGTVAVGEVVGHDAGWSFRDGVLGLHTGLADDTRILSAMRPRPTARATSVAIVESGIGRADAHSFRCWGVSSTKPALGMGWGFAVEVVERWRRYSAASFTALGNHWAGFPRPPLGINSSPACSAAAMTTGDLRHLAR